MTEDEQVAHWRAKLGLPANRFAGIGGGHGPGPYIVCKCIHCGKIFPTTSADLADVDHICKGDCGCKSK